MIPRSTDYPARSPVYRHWEGVTEPCGEALIAVANEPASAPCTLADLSPLARLAVRGPGAVAALQAADWPVPDKPNQLETAGSVIVARLGVSEHWLLNTALGHSLSPPDAVADAVCYEVPCQDSHAWFALRGPARHEVMAKLCGVDLAEAAFPVGSVAQTSVALISAIVLHHDCYGEPGFSLLCDVSFADYLWHALTDAMSEYGGEVTGVPRGVD